VGSTAVGISITRDGKTGFVALGPANRIAVINGATHEVQKYLLVGQRVWHMAFTPDEKYLLTTRRLHHRRCKSQGHQDDPGRRTSLGYRNFAAVTFSP